MHFRSFVLITAIALGRQLKFTLPIEDLLGGQLNLPFKPKAPAMK
ncbi:MAG: hypothetical protein Q8O00_05190 [Holophaga sp.]|nr:hypothetical protein [Holophaga sp.]